MTCREVRRRIEEIVRGTPDAVEATRDHLAECRACAEALTVRRAVGRLLAARVAERSDPPADFAQSVVARLPRQAPGREADPWRAAWGLIPAFTAAVVALMLAYQSTDTLAPGLLPIDDLSAGERVVLQEGGGSPDLLLSAILEGSR